MGFYATTEVKEKNRYTPVFRSDKSENRLIKSESLPSVPDEFKVCVENLYDYAGRRVKKTVKDDYSGGDYTTTNVTTFIYDGWLPIAEIGNGYTNYMTWGLDASGTLSGAGGCGGLLSKTTVTASDTNTYFYLYDGNANVVGMVDEAGSVVASYEYSPFGICIKAIGSQASNNAFRHSTHYFDIETGIYKAKHRDYSPTLGRFLSQDPIAELAVREGLPPIFVAAQMENPYRYCLNDPVNKIDPLGLVEYGFTVRFSTMDQAEFGRSSMDISYTYDCCKCEKVQFIQYAMTQSVTKWGIFYRTDIRPWHNDGGNPYYDEGYDDSPGCPNRRGWSRARVTDRPGVSETLGVRIVSLLQMFKTEAWCTAGPDSGTRYGTVEWGHYYSRNPYVVDGWSSAP